jgi:hypothetical protein
MIVCQRFHLVDCGFGGAPKVAAPEIELDLIAIQRVQVGQRIDQMRRLLRGRVDPPEQPPHVPVRRAIGHPATNRSYDDGEWILHVMGDRGEDRIAFGPQLTLAIRQTFGLELLCAFPGDEPANDARDDCENGEILPLFWRRQPARQQQVITGHGGDRGGQGGTSSRGKGDRYDKEHGKHHVDVVAYSITGGEYGESRSRNDAGDVRNDNPHGAMAEPNDVSRRPVRRIRR